MMWSASAMICSCTAILLFIMDSLSMFPYLECSSKTEHIDINLPDVDLWSVVGRGSSYHSSISLQKMWQYPRYLCLLFMLLMHPDMKLNTQKLTVVVMILTCVKSKFFLKFNYHPKKSAEIISFCLLFPLFPCIQIRSRTHWCSLHRWWSWFAGSVSCFFLHLPPPPKIETIS